MAVVVSACTGGGDAGPTSSVQVTATTSTTTTLPESPTTTQLAAVELFCTEPLPGEVVLDDVSALPNPDNPEDRPEGVYLSRFDVRDGPESAYTPCFVAAEDSDFEDDTVVIGLAMEDEARAYAIEQLVAHFVNDRIGDDPLLVSY